MEFVLVTILLVVILLLLLFIMYHILLTPSSRSSKSEWTKSVEEEKIQLSKTSNLFTTNGYLVQSNSLEMALGNRGSFKRFESVDRDASYNQSQSQQFSPQMVIPPQPSRNPPKPPITMMKSIDEHRHTPPTTPQTAPILIAAIPRPSPKKQLSAPVGNIPPLTPPIQKIRRQQTNPFLNGEEFEPAPKTNKNPFIDEQEEVFNFEPKHIESYESDPLKEVEARIYKLEAHRMKTQEEVLLPVVYNRFDKYKTKTELLNHIREISSSLDTTIEGLTNSLMSLEHLPKAPPLRTRSLSETQVEEFSTTTNLIDFSSEFHENTVNNNPFGSSNIHHQQKTASDLYLEKYIGQMPRSGKNYNLAQINNTDGSSLAKKVLVRQSSFGKSTTGCDVGVAMKRAISDESVCSESSVVLSDLEQITPPTTGSICIGLQYDKVNATDEGCELFVTVLEAKDLICPEPTETMDTFVRIYLVPDEKPNFGPLQTKIFKSSLSPSYQETFSFFILKSTTNRHIKRSLWFHLYHTGSRHTLIGETELKLTETSRPITLWLTLTDSRQNHFNWGELMFSLSYLPTAERLTVVVVKARNLRLPSADKLSSTSAELNNVYVKVYLLKNDKKVSKKKSTTKKGERCPLFCENFMFSIPPYMLQSVQLRLTVVNVSDNLNQPSIITPIGHVIVGSGTSGKGLKHWHQMLTTSLRKPVAMWHALRITHKHKSRSPRFGRAV